MKFGSQNKVSGSKTKDHIEEQGFIFWPVKWTTDMHRIEWLWNYSHEVSKDGKIHSRHRRTSVISGDSISINSNSKSSSDRNGKSNSSGNNSLSINCIIVISIVAELALGVHWFSVNRCPIISYDVSDHIFLKQIMCFEHFWWLLLSWHLVYEWDYSRTNGIYETVLITSHYGKTFKLYLETAKLTPHLVTRSKFPSNFKRENDILNLSEKKSVCFSRSHNS